MTSRLQSAIDSLKLTAGKTKQTKAVEDALGQLDSLPKLLELSKLSTDTFTRLCSLLRDRLLPLYHAYPTLTLQYSVSVLIVIHKEKISPIMEAGDEHTRASWETVQTAVLSGILDFLEEHATNGHRANVAAALYPVLRTVFFEYPSFGAGLSYTLYQLLSETATKQPVNQHMLRDSGILGGKQMGAILSQTKEFLAIEALLELFAKLLPSTKSKGGSEKRDTFIRQVFDPAVIAGSNEVFRILKTISASDWEATFLKIIDILARADNSYPQPFQTSNFCTHGLPTCTVERLYIDHSGFLANLDQDGELETLQISFPIVDGVQLAAPTTSKTSITIRLSSPPFVGPAVLAPLSERDMFLSFDIDNRDIARFLESLTNRGLKDVIQTQRKLSKAKAHLELDFQQKIKQTPISTQDKVQNLAQLWDYNGSSACSGEAMPTSPLLKGQYLSRQDTFSTIDGDNLPQPRPGDATAPIVLDSDDEAETTARSRPKTNRNSVVLSEDEAEMIDQPESESVSNSAMPVENSPAEIEVLESDIGTGRLASASYRIKPALPCEIKDTVPGDVVTNCLSAGEAFRPTSSTGMAANRPRMVKKMTSDVKLDVSTPTKLKRAAPQDLVPDSTGSGGNHYSPKRFRRDSSPSTNVITTPRTTKDLPMSKRYGRKGRTSSPTCPVAVFDKPHAAFTGTNVEKLKTRISTMKAKAGKKIAIEKPASETSKGVPDRTIEERALAYTASASIESKTTEMTNRGQAIQDIKPTRRSARVANIQAESVTSRETEVSTAREQQTSPESIPRYPISDELVQESPTRLKTKASSVNLPSPSTGKRILSDLVTDISSNKVNTSTSPVAEKPAIWRKPSKENDVVMIDLTQNIRKPLSKTTSLQNKPLDTTSALSHSLHSPEPLRKLPRPILPSPKVDSPHGAFASPLRDKQNRVFRGSLPGFRSDSHPLSKNRSVSPADDKNTYKRPASYRSMYGNHFVKETQVKEEPMTRIIDVITELTEVVVKNASRRFDNVRNDLLTGRNSILFGTADDLKRMHGASIDSFNALVDLEEEYADHRRNVIDGLSDLSKTTQEICRYLADTVQEGNRNSLSRKFSNVFFAHPLPVFISNPKIVV